MAAVAALGPAALGLVAALLVPGAAGSALALALATPGFAASAAIVLWQQARQGRRLAAAEAQLHDALAKQGPVDAPTGLETLPVLHTEWRRHLAIYERHGLRFSLALFDISPSGGRTADSAIGELAVSLRGISRVEDRIFRLGETRVGVLLAGSDYDGALAYVARVRHHLGVVAVDNFASGPLELGFDIVDPRESVAGLALPEGRATVNAPSLERLLFTRQSGQRGSKAAGQAGVRRAPRRYVA